MPYHDFDANQSAKEEKARSSRCNLRVYLIRHAESEANLRKGEIGGRQNEVNLSEKGVAQAQLLGKRLRAAGIALDAVYSSVANRALQTAQLACGEMGIPEERIRREASIVEQSQGSWERVDRKTVYTPEVMAEMNRRNWSWAAPGCSSIDGARGESQRDVEVRMMAFLESILSRDEGSVEQNHELDGPINTVIEKANRDKTPCMSLCLHLCACLLCAFEFSSASIERTCVCVGQVPDGSCLHPRDGDQVPYEGHRASKSGSDSQANTFLSLNHTLRPGGHS